MKRSAPSSAGLPSRWLRAALLAPLYAYQRFLSPALPQRCKYYPTCSAYAVEAIRELGVIRGTILAAWRLLRCNPFSHGGYDPVCARRWFRGPEPERARAEDVPAGTVRKRTRSGAFRATDSARAGGEHVAR